MGMILLPIVLLSIAVMGADKEATAAVKERMKPFSRGCLIFSAIVAAIFILGGRY